MNDLIYKINSVWLYPNQLNHDYVLLHNEGDLYWLFGNTAHSANTKILNLKNTNLKESEINEKSVFLMKEAADRSNVKMVKSTDFIIAKPNEESNSHYKVYDIYWNETKSGINPFEYKKFSVWNEGETSYSSYGIKYFKEEREKVFSAWWRDKQINSILDD